MRAEELMVGDWVFAVDCAKPNAYRVTKVNAQPENGEYPIHIDRPADGLPYTFLDFDQVEPIPLDCEIMWKNGFEDYNTTLRESWKKCSDFTARSFEHPMDVNERYAIIKVMFQENSFGVEIHTGKPTEDLRALACDKSATSNMRYVHELQHALRLCGIEKEIKL